MSIVMGKEERGNGEQCSYEYMQKQVHTDVQIKSILVCGHFIHMNLWTYLWRNGPQICVLWYPHVCG